MSSAMYFFLFYSNAMAWQIYCLLETSKTSANDFVVFKCVDILQKYSDPRSAPL